MLTFNPGPSQISPRVKDFMREFIDSDTASISHRSKQFTQISLQARNGLIQYMGIPEGYKVFYLASASEGMEVILRNTVISRSHHLINGSFGKKWKAIASQINKQPTSEEIALGRGDFSLQIPHDSELICLTDNETSTGVKIPSQMIKNLRMSHPDKLIAIDITSSAGGIKHDIADADMWFFSVQKCFGLPSGLGIFIANEKAITRSAQVYEVTKDTGSIHSFVTMLKRYPEGQTDETPNISDIFLLGKQLEYFNSLGIETIEKQTLEKHAFIHAQIQKSSHFSSFVTDSSYLSPTVYVFNCELALQEKVKSSLKDAGVSIGSGYGDVKDSTLRIANFPSVSMSDLEKLFKVLNTI